ncbi:hypothetical protein POM88_021061 [Heracleum sosnowskyi]|uniref:Uncharacterized protein n=1 Tax=Heracleum sosnowskyi TaxID=360622 RepID=A0AAD8MS13_9APIA|nr:hypothetical protein POM88_021061 [Heracleum sosnowskyi]
MLGITGISPERDNSFEDFQETRPKGSKRTRVTGEASVPEPGSCNSLIGHLMENIESKNLLHRDFSVSLFNSKYELLLRVLIMSFQCKNGTWNFLLAAPSNAFNWGYGGSVSPSSPIIAADSLMHYHLYYSSNKIVLLEDHVTCIFTCPDMEHSLELGAWSLFDLFMVIHKTSFASGTLLVSMLYQCSFDRWFGLCS